VTIVDLHTVYLCGLGSSEKGRLHRGGGRVELTADKRGQMFDGLQTSAFVAGLPTSNVTNPG